MSIITSGSGENLRVFLTDGVQIESVIDFGDLQVFEGVTTYPAIVTLRKGGDGKAGNLSFLKLDEWPKDLGLVFNEHTRTMLRARLGAGSWQCEEEPLASLRDKIAKGRRTLGEVYGPPLYGIKTGLNEAFIIDMATRDRLLRADPKSADVLKPFLRGENIKRWRVEPEGLWLINTPKGKVDIEAYPAIRDWLLPFRAELEKRATQQEWWELQQAQLAYQPKFETPKIIYGHFAQERIFAFDVDNFLSNDKSYFIPNASFDLLGFLNAKLCWFILTGLSPAVRDQWHELRVQYVEQLPIPDMPPDSRVRFAALGQICTDAAQERFEIQSAVRRCILDLSSPERAKLTGPSSASRSSAPSGRTSRSGSAASGKPICATTPPASGSCRSESLPPSGRSTQSSMTCSRLRPMRSVCWKPPSKGNIDSATRWRGRAKPARSSQASGRAAAASRSVRARRAEAAPPQAAKLQVVPPPSNAGCQIRP